MENHQLRADLEVAEGATELIIIAAETLIAAKQ